MDTSASSKIPPIYFWLPARAWPESFPERAEDFVPQRGYHSWIAQTYLRLKEAGFECYQTEELPKSGIIIGYRDFFSYEFKPGAKQFCVCIKADCNPHPYTQLQITHNATEVDAPNLQVNAISPDYYLLTSRRYYIPHWPQPGLIPRDDRRGTQIQNVTFYGSSYNLAPELKHSQWREFLEFQGMNWCLEEQRDRWKDYSQVDLVVAVRSFTQTTDYPWKPASKLFNGWRAGVPCILGVESAFQGERKSELDYIEVRSYEETMAAVKRLQNDPQLYQAMQENGRQRAKEVEIPRMVERWKLFLLDVAVPGYEEWCAKSPAERRWYFLQRRLAEKVSRAKREVRRRLTPKA